jgi:hypothetical protein
MARWLAPITACLQTPPRSHTARSFLLEHSVVVPAAFDAVATEAARAWLSDSWELVHPSGSGSVYANSPIRTYPTSTALTGAPTSSACGA